MIAATRSRVPFDAPPASSHRSRRALPERVLNAAVKCNSRRAVVRVSIAVHDVAAEHAGSGSIWSLPHTRAAR